MIRRIASGLFQYLSPRIIDRYLGCTNGLAGKGSERDELIYRSFPKGKVLRMDRISLDRDKPISGSCYREFVSFYDLRLSVYFRECC